MFLELAGILFPIVCFLDLVGYRAKVSPHALTLTQWTVVTAVNLAFIAALAGVAIEVLRSGVRTPRLGCGGHTEIVKGQLSRWSGFLRRPELWLGWVVVAAHVCAKIPYLDLAPRWDAGTYFEWVAAATQKFELTFESIANQFRLAGHPSHVYGLYLAMGQILFPWNHAVTNVQNLILSALGIYGFWLLLRRVFPEWSPRLCFVATLLLAFNPLYFGAGMHTNTDLPVTVFLILVLTSFVYKRALLFSFVGLCLCFSKEPGTMAYALLLGLLFLFYVLPRAKSLAHAVMDLDLLLRFPEEPTTPLQRGPIGALRSLGVATLALLPLVVFWVYLRSVPKVSWTSSTSIWNDAGYLCFGLNSRMFRTVLGEAFVLNFSWIPTLLVLLYLARQQIFGTPRQVVTFEARTRLLRALAWLFAAYLLVHCLYINYLNARYVLGLAPLGLLLAGFALNALLRSERWQLVSAGAFAILCVIQTWHALDPISNRLWSTFKIGDREVLHVGGDIRADTQGKADGIVYNAQFSAIERLYRAVNREYMGRKPTPVMYFGSGEYWLVYYCIGPLRIDPKTLEYTTKPDGLPIGLAAIDEISASRNYPLAIYVSMPWIEDPSQSLRKLLVLHDIKSVKRIRYGDYYVDAYEVEPRRVN